MRKFAAGVLSVLLMICFSICTFAVDYEVYGETVEANDGDVISIPVRLRDNKGIMGFKITVVYPSEVLSSPRVSSGSLTGKGTFNDSIKSTTKGKFDVVWSSTEDVNGEGTLFVMTFNVQKTGKEGPYPIKLLYSDDDTFNQEWKTVHLSCSPITINLNSKPLTSGSTQESITTQTVSESNGTEQISDDLIIKSCEAVLESFGIRSIDDASADEKKSILAFVNNSIESQNPGSEKIETVEDFENKYNQAIHNEAVKEVLASVDGDVILQTADELFEKYSVKSFGEIDSSQKKAAVQEFFQKLNESGAEIKNVKKIENANELARIADEIVSAANEQQNPRGNKEHNIKLIIIISAAAMVTAGSVTVIIIARKRRKK